MPNTGQLQFLTPPSQLGYSMPTLFLPGSEAKVSVPGGLGVVQAAAGVPGQVSAVPVLAPNTGCKSGPIDSLPQRDHHLCEGYHPWPAICMG